MRFDVDGGTDAALMLLFDPGAVPPEFDFNEVYDFAERGLCLLYAPAADGGYDATILVDEEPPADWREYLGHHVEGALLRVPSGELWWSGAEYIFATQTTEGPRAKKPLGHMGGKCSVSPGNYRVHAFEVNWPEETQERLLHERTPTADRVYETVIGCVGQLGCASMFLIFVIGSLALVQFRQKWTWPAAGAWVMYIVIGYALFWLIMYPLARSNAMKRMDAARKHVAREFPGTVIVLHRLPDDADLAPMRGGIFGEGADTSTAWRESE